MKHLLQCMTVIALFIPCIGMRAQEQNRSQAVYLELFGASNLIGVNFDERFKVSSETGFGWRTGLGFGFSSSSISHAFNISEGEIKEIDVYNKLFRLSAPVGVNYLLGKSNSKIETEIGAILCFDHYLSAGDAGSVNQFGIIPYLSLGYRYVSEKGFLFRVGVLPIYNYASKRLTFYPQISIGRAF